MGITKQLRGRASRAADVDGGALRARIVDIVQDAIDQVESVVAEAPKPTVDDAKDMARRVRRSQAVEAAGAAIAAGMPIAARVARQQLNRRNARRARKVLPVFARSHPLLLGVGIVGGVLVGLELLHRRRAPDASVGARRLVRRADEHSAQPATGFDLDEEVARMEGEGGDTGAGPGALGSTSRGLARIGGDGSRAGRR